jgi:hypothetical protein
MRYCWQLAVGCSVATFLFVRFGLPASCAQAIGRTSMDSRDTAGPIPDYKKIVFDSLTADPDKSERLDEGLPFKARQYSTTRLFLDPASMAPFEISGLKQVRARFGMSWITCLKANLGNRPAYYAIFIQNNYIVDARSVLIDQCEREEFTPLNVVLPARKDPSLLSPLH